MPRQIIVEEPEKTISSENATTVASNPILSAEPAQVLVSSYELTQLFNEWNQNGQNDLAINPSLSDRIQQYLNYQEELDPLRAKLAERIYKPFVDTPHDDYKDLRFFINSDYITSGNIFARESENSYYRLITLVTFKCILLALNNPYAPYIVASERTYVDIVTYILSIGMHFKWENGEFTIIT